MISRAVRAFCYSLFCCTASVASAQVPLNDTPPTLSLPPLPSLPKTGEKKPEAPAPAKPTPPLGIAPKKSAPSLPADRQTSTSGDGQFIIHGADLTTRSWFSTQCETVASDLRRLLRDPAPWSIPINISVRTAPNISLTDPAVVMGVRPLMPSGFQLQVTVQMRPDLNSNDLRTEMIRVLLAERILRDHDQLTSTRRPILPEWLFTGVTEALRFRERARPSATFAAVFKTGRVFGIEEILGAAPTAMDALSRTIYETSSCALVLMLMDQPEGNLRMAKFLHALASDSRSDRDVLNQWFPGLNTSKSSLDKWWSLQMAHMSRPSVWETLDPQETAKALELALSFRYEAEVDVNDAPARPRTRATESEPEETPKAPDEEKRSLFGRIFGASHKPDEETDKPKQEKSKADKPKPEKKPEPSAQEGQTTPLFTRLFGGSDDKKKDEPKKPAKKEEKKPEPKKEETKPKPKPAPEPKKPESKKKEETKKSDQPAPPSLLRRLFSGGDKDKAKEESKTKDSKKPEPEKKKEDAPKKSEDKESASLAAPLLMRLLADLALPHASILFDAHEFVSAPSSHEVITLFGKKKDPEEQAKEDAEKKRAADEKKAKEAADKKKKDDAKKADAAKRDEEAKLAAAKKAEAKKAKEEPKPEPKKEAPKKAREPEPKTVPKTAAKKRKTIVSVPLEEYAKVLKRPDGKAIMASTAADLSALVHRAHPLFQPIISDYVSLIAQIATTNVKDAAAQLKKLRERTANALKQARAVQEHIDWFEAENSKWSGTFDDYLHLKETIQSEMPKRTDALSRLLDEAEKQPLPK